MFIYGIEAEIHFAPQIPMDIMKLSNQFTTHWRNIIRVRQRIYVFTLQYVGVCCEQKNGLKTFHLKSNFERKPQVPDPFPPIKSLVSDTLRFVVQSSGIQIFLPTTSSKRSIVVKPVMLILGSFQNSQMV